MYFQKAKEFAFTKLRERLPDNLYYHGVHHTEDVCKAADEIASCEGITGESLVLLATAALFHDMGFIVQYQNHEEASCRLAEIKLIQFGYSIAQIEIIKGLIMATRIPQTPHTHLEEIICDADLDYLGREDFFEIAQTLQKEWMAVGIIKSIENWNKIQVRFLEDHHYFTNTAKKNRNAVKEKNLQKLKMFL